MSHLSRMTGRADPVVAEDDASRSQFENSSVSAFFECELGWARSQSWEYISQRRAVKPTMVCYVRIDHMAEYVAKANLYPCL